LADSPVIRVEDLSFTYNSTSANPIVALRGIDLEVRRGEYLAIVGHNGSGKSTLARNLNALLLPTGGNVWVNGMNTRDPSCTRAIRSTVGMVFQIPDNQIVATIVEEDVAFGPENLGVPEEELVERVRWALETVGMLPYRNRAPHRLSAGQKQRVAIAGVIAMKPQVLVLDESTAMLDPLGRRDVLAAVRKLHQQGVTVIAITHFMDEAVEADRVIVMEAGRIVMEGSPRQIFSRAEELRQLQLDVPQVTELAQALHRRLPDFPAALLTVDEVVAAVTARKASILPPPVIVHRANASPAKTGEERGNTRRNGDVMIEVHDLHHAYLRDTPLETVALRGVSLEIRRGETIGIIGRTGAGKSTLLQHFNGLIRPRQRGVVLVEGEDLSDTSVDVRALRQKVGLVFQYPEQQLFERLVGDDIAFGPRQLGLPGPERRERVQWAMEMVGLDFEKFKDRLTFSLSGGEMRKAALAGVLALKPQVLILDESTSGLDPRGRREFLERIAALNRDYGLTILFVSSNMEDIAGLAERIYVIDQGQTVLSGTTRDIFANPERLAQYGATVPQVTEVLYRLNRQRAVNCATTNLDGATTNLAPEQTPLTVAEAVEQMWKMLS
jgi:energy-coupling factor transporter ATPase